MTRWLDARRPVALFSNGFGDHLLALPALRALASLFPGRLTLVVETGSRQTFFGDVAARKVVETDFVYVPDERAKRFDADAVCAEIGECDLFLSLIPWHGPSIDRLLELWRPRSIGFEVGGRRAFTRSLERDFSKHSAELTFDVPRALAPELRLDDFAAPPADPPLGIDERRGLRSILGRLGSRPLLAVHTDPDESIRAWPAPLWRRTLDCVLDHHPDLLVSPLGLETPDLAPRHRERLLTAATPLSLRSALRLTARSSFFLGVDSVFLHAADLHRVPGVGLFAPTDPVEWGFRFGPGRHVGAERMDDLDPAAVERAVDQLMASSARRLRASSSRRSP